MSAHTPGPWTMTEESGDCDLSMSHQIGIDAVVREEEGFDTYLATVVHGDPDELLANARLIAAAPDLLASLEAASNYIDTLGGVSKEYRAALSKARELK